MLLVVAGVLVGLRLRSLDPESRSKRLRRLALPEDPVRRRLFWGAEIVFAVTFALGAFFAASAPDVWNTEKPMDMAFITAINASDSFPPHDPWMSGEQLNYYYFGHVIFAWPIQLLGLRPDAGYLLSWGCCSRSPPPPCTRSAARSGPPRARPSATARRAAGRCSRGSSARRWSRSSATSPACGRGSGPRTRPRTTPGSTRRA